VAWGLCVTDDRDLVGAVGGRGQRIAPIVGAQILGSMDRKALACVNLWGRSGGVRAWGSR
jgi:hypothetical protein